MQLTLRFLLFLPLFVLGCAAPRPSPSPPHFLPTGSEWLSHAALVEYEHDGKKTKFHLSANWLNDWDYDKRKPTGGLIVRSGPSTAEYLKLSQDETTYRIQGTLIPGYPRVIEGKVSEAPKGVRGWLRLYDQYVRAQGKPPTRFQITDPETGDRWDYWFLYVELYDDALNRPGDSARRLPPKHLGVRFKDVKPKIDRILEYSIDRERVPSTEHTWHLPGYRQEKTALRMTLDGEYVDGLGYAFYFGFDKEREEHYRQSLPVLKELAARFAPSLKLTEKQIHQHLQRAKSEDKPVRLVAGVAGKVAVTFEYHQHYKVSPQYHHFSVSFQSTASPEPR